MTPFFLCRLPKFMQDLTVHLADVKMLMVVDQSLHSLCYSSPSAVQTIGHFLFGGLFSAHFKNAINVLFSCPKTSNIELETVSLSFKYNGF